MYEDNGSDKIELPGPKVIKGKSIGETNASGRASSQKAGEPAGCQVDMHQEKDHYKLPQPEFVTEAEYFRRMYPDMAQPQVAKSKKKR